MVWNLILALIAQFASAPYATEASLSAIPVVDSIEVSGFAERHSKFEVRFRDASTDYRIMAMFALPGERIPIAAGDTLAVGAWAAQVDTAQYELIAAAGTTKATGANRWNWVAPARPGLYPIQVRDSRAGGSVTLNVFVMTPYSDMHRGTLNGYRIGDYPKPRRGYEAEYQRPLGFGQVTPELLDTQVSPHFKLGQFLCKQTGDFPQYIVLRQPLLLKLEQLLASVNERGISASTFSIMSAYRTPSYNAAIGNETIFSRHEYGDAADVFVDDDDDGIMDDLNHDGRHTIADARVLGAIMNELQGTAEFSGLIGGLGTYAPTPEHGPFMHVDTRGFSVEWGA